MTLGSVEAGWPFMADAEVSGLETQRIPLSRANSQWYFHAVAIVRAGKPPRTPTRAVATSRLRQAELHPGARCRHRCL